MEVVYLGFAVAMLLLVNAVLVSCELSLVKLRYKTVSRKGNDTEGEVVGEVERILKLGEETARSIRLGYSGCMIGMGLLLYPLIASLTGWETVSWALLFMVYSVLIGVHYLICGLMPRAFALADPEKILRKLFVFLRVFGWVTAPAVLIMKWTDQWVLSKLELDDEDSFNDLDVEVQIRALYQDDKELSLMTRNILHNTFRLAELEVGDVLLPRRQVNIFDLNADLESNFEIAKSSGHTRFPLCEGDLDHCIGIVHIKDVFRKKNTDEVLDLRKIRRRIPSIRLNESLENALQMLLLQKKHMALVKDDFGGAVGVITLETILEELVGDIQDEFDVEEEQITPLEKGVFRISGLTPIHDVEEILDVEIDEEEASTFGGLITSRLGRIPNVDEKFSLEDLGLEVTADEVSERRVISVTVRLIGENED